MKPEPHSISISITISLPFLQRVVSVVTLLLCFPLSGMAEPRIPSLTTTSLDPDLKGLILIEELNCAACHTAGESLKSRSKKAPRLSQVGSRANPYSLEKFIQDPHGILPGTTMPDLLTPLDADQKSRIAHTITHFLVSKSGNGFSVEAPDRVAAEHGKRLFHSRGCAACHAPRDDQGRETGDLAQSSSPLGDLDSKYGFKSLTAFLRQPHASRPSGRMPDMRLQGQDVERIAHYLLQHTQVPGSLNYTLYRGDVWEGIRGENVNPERAGHVKDFALESLGKVQHHTAIQYDGWIQVTEPGRYTFYATWNGGDLSVDGKEVLQQKPSDHRGVKELEGSMDLPAGWKRIQLTYIHTGHDPRFSLEMKGPGMARQPISTKMLSVSNEPVAAYKPWKVDAELAAQGREWFGKLGCANCHDDMDVEVAPQRGLGFAQLQVGRGCLSGTLGDWPHYRLSEEQRGWIHRALATAESPNLDDGQRLHKSMATFNCTACHERSGLGGIASERNALFTGTQPSMGDQGRLPPPLTHAGAKLKPEWMTEVMLHGKRSRRYLDSSMPQFGEANIGHMAGLFGKVDSLESVPIPKPADQEKSRNAGYEMVGSTGLSCIACHEFNGQKSSEVGAVDIARVAERLQKNWFHLYLRQPSRFHPSVIMPSYWPDGQSVRPNILGGDAAQQIEALWVYLEDGVRARKPMGLSRESNELRVGDVTEICRGQSPVGYRGIGVGYPERINLAFDSGEMALRQMWKGEFASVDSGHFHPRGTDSIAFPPGVPFHRLQSMEDPWPYKGKNNHAFPQDHGYQFRGYHLDSQRRPTFLYQYGDVSVTDHFEDVRDKDGKPYFKRTIQWEGSPESKPFYFRAAQGAPVIAASDTRYEVGELKVRIMSEHRGLVRGGGAADRTGELLIPLTVSQGRSTLILEYQW